MYIIFFFHKGRRRPTAIFEHLFHDLHLKKETTEYMCDEPKNCCSKREWLRLRIPDTRYLKTVWACWRKINFSPLFVFDRPLDNYACVPRKKWFEEIGKQSKSYTLYVYGWWTAMESILLKRTQEKIIKCKMMSFDFPKSLIGPFAIGRRKNNIIPENDDRFFTYCCLEWTFMLEIYHELQSVQQYWECNACYYMKEEFSIF